MTERTNTGQYASSTGQSGTEAAWLDVHFEALRPEYERSVRMVGLEPGWHVLDAGCGAGNFIPVLANEVGPLGTITAVDLAPENIERVRQRLTAWSLPCQVDAQVASLDSLPFADDTFDAAWLGNVLIYFSREELAQVLQELIRVVRPGGIIAAKENDGRSGVIYPMPTTPDHYAPILGLDRAISGIYDVRGIHHRFRDAGLMDVTQSTILIERWAPLGDLDRQYIGTLLQSFAKGSAKRLSLGADAAAFWQQQEDPASPDALVNHPEFALAIGHVLTIGRVPSSR